MSRANIFILVKMDPATCGIQKQKNLWRYLFHVPCPSPKVKDIIRSEGCKIFMSLQIEAQNHSNTKQWLTLKSLESFLTEEKYQVKESTQN